MDKTTISQNGTMSVLESFVRKRKDFFPELAKVKGARFVFRCVMKNDAVEKEINKARNGFYKPTSHNYFWNLLLYLNSNVPEDKHHDKECVISSAKMNVYRTAFNQALKNGYATVDTTKIMNAYNNYYVKVIGIQHQEAEQPSKPVFRTANGDLLQGEGVAHVDIKPSLKTREKSTIEDKTQHDPNAQEVKKAEIEAKTAEASVNKVADEVKADNALPRLEYISLLDILKENEAIEDKLIKFIEAKSAEKQTNTDYVISSMFAFIGASIGRRCKVKLFGYEDNLCLQVALIGRSGSNKSQGYKAVIAPTADYNKELVAQSDKEYFSYLNKKQANTAEYIQEPSQHQVLCEDTTPEALWGIVAHNDVIDIHDELSAMFANSTRYSRSNDELQKRMSIYDNADSIIINRVDRSKNLFIKQPFLSTLGTMQPMVLKKYFGADRLETGFTQRWIFAYPDKENYPISAKTPNELNNYWHDLIFSNYHNNYDDIDNTFIYDNDAQKVANQFYKYIKKYVSQLDDIDTIQAVNQASYIDKALYTFAKLSGIVHAMGHFQNSKYISEAEAMTAEGLTRHFMNIYLYKVLPIIEELPKVKKIGKYEAIRILFEELPEMNCSQLAKALKIDVSIINKLKNGKK